MQKVIVTSFTVSIFLFLSGFKPEGNTTLKVEVTNFENKASTKVWVSVFSEKDFLENPFRQNLLSHQAIR
jgi:hypothetical protein